MKKVETASKYRVNVQGFEAYQARTSCRSACPLGTDTRGYVRAVADGDYAKAFLIARRTNPLVSICGRICQAPCEDACGKGGGEGPVALRALKRFACEQHGIRSPRVVERMLDEINETGGPALDVTGSDVLELARLRRSRADTGREPEGVGGRVAVIGSGPAGLAAAHDLALLGYKVTIFEAAPVPGGMLRWGIPEFRLPRDLIQREIDAILGMGVELELNSPIGERKTLTDLRKEGFRAVFVAAGLHAPRSLNLEGTHLRGVFNGLTYLRDYKMIPVGKNCVVVGGGGVAIDCAQLALRQGAENVVVVCLESWEEMPARSHEKNDASEEGIRFHPSLGPKRILGEDGAVTDVEFLEVESVIDGQGNFRPVLRPRTEKVLKADSVILAVGQASGFPVFQGMDALDTTPAGTIRVGEKCETNLPGVFAGGDIVYGPQSVVKAVADGRKAARAMHEYLGGRKLRLRKKGFMQILEPGFENTRCERIKPVAPPRRPAAERVRNRGGIDLVYTEGRAREQAARCRQCNIQTVFNQRLCILCGTCVDTCVHNAYKMVRLEDVKGDETFRKVTQALRTRARPGRKMTAVIKDEERCVRCGACARRCPTGALTMEAFHFEEVWDYERVVEQHPPIEG